MKNELEVELEVCGNWDVSGADFVGFGIICFAWLHIHEKEKHKNLNVNPIFYIVKLVSGTLKHIKQNMYNLNKIYSAYLSNPRFILIIKIPKHI